MAHVRPTSARGLTPVAVLEAVLVVVGVALALLLVYELRRPLTYLFVAIILAIALARPVAFFERRMRRGFAIAVVYLMLVGFPVLLGALFLLPLWHPVLLAEQLGTLASIAQGPFVM